MNSPEYITKTEVQKVCEELGLRDWTTITNDQVSEEETALILKALQFKDFKIPVSVFKQGLEVELEHGTRYPDANVTNNHPLLTARIVLAHLKETLDYYHRLDVAEMEGDLLKAAANNKTDKMITIYQRLVNSKLKLIQVEKESISHI